MAEWLSAWLAEQEVWGSIPRLTTLISEIGYLPLPSRDMAEIPLKRRKSSIQPTNQLCINHRYEGFLNLSLKVHEPFPLLPSQRRGTLFLKRSKEGEPLTTSDEPLATSEEPLAASEEPLAGSEELMEETQLSE